jgi:hypothetical protein
MTKKLLSLSSPSLLSLTSPSLLSLSLSGGKQAVLCLAALLLGAP